MSPIRLGAENRRQVYLLAFLGLVILAIGGWEVESSFSGPPASISPDHAHGVGRSLNREVTAEGPEPHLHIGQIARSEGVGYSETGRDIFSAEAAPVLIEAPIAPPRPAVLPAPPERPKIPAIDVKYLGYAQTDGPAYRAILVHGNDSLLAKSGEIIFHRYRVGPIKPVSVQITDLILNSSQTISVGEK